MCVILVSSNGVSVARSWARDAWLLNPDGGGVAWADSKGRWVVERGLMTFREWWRVYRRAVDRWGTVVAHLRLRSSGELGRECTHPVPVPGHPGWWLAHNGSVAASGPFRAVMAAAGVEWDTAAAAWLLGRTPRGRWVGVLESLGGRWVLLGPGRYWVVGVGWRKDHPVPGVRSCGCLPGEWDLLRGWQVGRGVSSVAGGSGAGVGGRVVSFGGASSGASGSWESSDWLLRGWSHVD